VPRRNRAGVVARGHEQECASKGEKRTAQSILPKSGIPRNNFSEAETGSAVTPRDRTGTGIAP